MKILRCNNCKVKQYCEKDDDEDKIQTCPLCRSNLLIFYKNDKPFPNNVQELNRVECLKLKGQVGKFDRVTRSKQLKGGLKEEDKMSAQKTKAPKKEKKVATEKVPGISKIRAENAEKVMAFMIDTLKVTDKAEQRKICSNLYGKIVKLQKAK